ncbi:MAG: mechanosensitive ion channel family protein [Gallionella sp.]|nr:mechanosensitive ion channel family protein [Gallionella sp.]MDD4946645.1 mechanosensitive ion channel family protein [Gallionella sp.]MDD5612961.1 mechanosensitive ion channel family protein [Gallionella sp.]
MNTFFNELSEHHLTLLAVLAATLAAHFVMRLAFRHFSALTAKTSNVWDDALLEAAKRPLPLLIWLTGLFTALQVHYAMTDRELPHLIISLRIILITVCVAWYLFALIRHAAANSVAIQTARGEEVDFTTIHGISKLARIVVVVLTGLVIAQSLGFSISGVLAFGGVGGIAVGFAAKDLLANFFGGLMLHLDRPFKLGDTIRSPDKDIEGRVEYIGWRQTALRGRNMDMIYVPNSLFNAVVLVNLSRRSHRRIEETIGLRYQDMAAVTGICEEMRAMLRARADIDPSRDAIVSFNRYGESSLEIYLLAFTLTTDFAEFNAAKQAILLEVATIVARHGADFPFPTRTLHLADGSLTASNP